MPHYVTKPTHASRKYYIFSTVVDAPISKRMYRTEMEQWLKDNGYEAYLNPTPMNEDPEILKHYDTPSLRELLDDMTAKTYWNGSFWYVLEEDNYFV